MTPEQMRIAIAEECGVKPSQKLETGRWFGRNRGGAWVEVPNFPRDQNAMAEALKTLPPGLRAVFGENLHLIVHPSGPSMAAGFDVWIGANATAAQRAEAFLRTIGRWIETKEGV